MHHHYRSRHVIDTLNRLGFGSSYNEVIKFERNACTNVKKSPNGQITEESTLHFVADNIDHNTSTLNGDNTMYGMGIIVAVTKGKFTQIDVQRKLISNEDINRLAKINVLHYYEESNTESIFKYENIKMSSIMTSSPEEFLWQYSWFFKDPLPSWSGSMKLIHSHTPLKHAGKASITILSIIDLMPSDMNCIFSTLKFVSNHAYSLEKPTIIKFDQPLFWKASKIIQNKANPVLKKIIATSGTFHTAMNLLRPLAQSWKTLV